jgi:DNA-binding response OmpR family regulator
MTDFAQPAQQEPGTILIVDDDQIMRHLLRHLLESDGHVVHEAEDGNNIMEVLATTRPDLILLDAMIPGIDGFEICRMIQTLPANERVPVLIITALEEEEYVDRAFEAGAVDYVNKPINFAVLRQRVRRLIAMRRLEQMRDELTQMIVHDRHHSWLLRDLNLGPERQRRRIRSASTHLLQQQLSAGYDHDVAGYEPHRRRQARAQATTTQCFRSAD